MPIQFLRLAGSLFMGGFLAVYLYQKRTKMPVTVREGARMGWITGVFCFLLGVLLSTMGVLAMSSRGGLAAVYREQVKRNPSIAQDANVEQFLTIIQEPAGLFTVLALSLVMMFVLSTLLPALGGALGAKYLERNPSDPDTHRQPGH